MFKINFDRLMQDSEVTFNLVGSMVYLENNKIWIIWIDSANYLKVKKKIDRCTYGKKND